MQNEINELRNQVRTLKRMLFGVFGVVVVGGLLAATSLQSVPDIIQAKKFEVVNGDGKRVVTISADEIGGAFVVLNNDEKPVVGVLSNAEGGSFSVYNKDGTPAFGMITKANGGQLGIANKDGLPAALIFADADGGGVIVTTDSNGLMRQL